MDIGILECGAPPAGIGTAVPSYSQMIRRALGSAYSYKEFDARAGQLPAAGSRADAYVITGSASSAYDTAFWIEGLRQWLVALDPSMPLVGICFGHQIMAHSYGGSVQKASQGRALGLHEYAVSGRESWMNGVETFVLPASHYDQVVTPPADATVIARSSFCPYAALRYRSRYAMSFQAHPEFPLDYLSHLIDSNERRGVVGSERADQARQSLHRPHDCACVNGWIRRFIDEGSR